MFTKIAFKILSVILLFFITVEKTSASDSFETTANIEYKISENGVTYVTSSILIKNLTSESYPESFVFTLDNLQSENLTIYEEGDKLEPNFDSQNPQKILLNFKKKIAGLDKTKSILVTFESHDIAIKSGDIWEVNIPQMSEISNIYDHINIRVLVPRTFGDEALINPNPDKIIHDEKFFVYTFTSNTGKRLNKGINISFGKFQYFNFTLKYHLASENENYLEIPLPPDTSLQKIYIKNINPAPNKVNIDEDGNWIATFRVDKGKTTDVEVFGSAKIFSSPIRYLPAPTEDYLQKTLMPSKYWNITDTKLNLLAQSIETPFDIYKLSSSYLSYNPDRAVPNAKRLGVTETIEHPKDALCTEYSDFFISLARAKGIPAREIQGFAQTDNEEIMPLSLVTDVLHSWVEFWDSENGLWIPADPTWASTNKNVEYFNSLDMKHLAFVIHGTDPERPFPPGSYKSENSQQKDVFVTYGTYDLKDLPQRKLETNYTFKTGYSLFAKTLSIKIKNTSTEAVYNKILDILIDNYSRSEIITLPPYGEFTKEITINYGPFGRYSPKNILLFVDGEKITVEPKSEYHLYRDLAFVSILLALITFSVMLKIRTFTEHN